jgi:hypothetical protein
VGALTQGAGKYTKNDFLQLVIALIVERALPIRFIESRCFKNIIEYLMPRALNDLPGRNGMSALIENEFIRMQQRLKTMLAQSTHKIALIVDGWSSRNHQGYFAILAATMLPAN